MEPKRSAHATIRGYVYQAVLGVQHWLGLKPGEILLCEGDEDLDRLLLSGERVATQSKDYVGSLNIRDAAVRDSLFNFLRVFVARRREGRTERFVFVTTAAQRAQRGDDLPVDVLKEWSNRDRRAAVIDAVRAVVEARDVAWLDEEAGRWDAFIESVEWNFQAPGLDDLLQEIHETLQRDARTSHLPASLLGPSLLAAVLRASTHGSASLRMLSAGDLDAVVGRTVEELRSWSGSREALFARALFDEAAQLRRILRQGRSRLPEDLRNPGRLLRPEFEVVPFAEAGRAGDFDALEQWCADADERSAAVWLWTGPGGIGKTRFFIEWCRRLGRRGWHAGFVKASATTDEIRTLFEGQMPCFAVIDYAETRRPLVERLLQMLAEHSEDRKAPPVRIVLVSRRAGDWWEQLRHVDGLIENLVERTRDPRELRSLAPSAGEREPLFRTAAAALACALGKAEPTVQRPLALDDPLFDRVLFLHVAALAAVEGQQLRDRGELLRFALDHEKRFWFQDRNDDRIDPLTKQALDDAMEPVVAGLTLVGGSRDREAALSLIERVSSLTPERASWVVDRLTRLYSGDQGTGLLSALQPDLLGQYAVASFLSRCDRGETEFGGVRSFLERLLAGADEAALASTLTVVGRIAAGAERDAGCRWLRDMLSDHLEERIPVAMRVAIELGNGATPSPVERVLIEALEQDGTPQLAERISALCPEQTLSLAEIKAVAKDIIVTHLKSLPDVESEEGRARLAKEQANYGVALSHLGKREAALAATHEAVEIYRTLAAVRPDAFLPYLATSLNNLGGTLTHLGKREAALAATQEAVAIRRTLAAARPEASLPGLALSLSSMGAALTQLGKREAALAATQQSVEVYRRLAATRPDAFLPELAGALNNLGNRFGAVGKLEAALIPIKEAVELSRSLAAAHPDAFLPDLALYLHNLGNWLSELGNKQAALLVTQEAADIRRALARGHPDKFLPDLAGSLNNLGNMLGAMGKREAALAATREAVELYRTLAAAHSDRFLPDLALSLRNLAGRLSTEEKREGLTVAQEAVEIHRTLAAAHPDAFVPNLAMSLNTLGIQLSNFGQHEAAVTAARESVEIRRALVAAHPDAFLPDLATSLNCLGNWLSCLGKSEEALAATQEAVEIRRTLAAARPDLFAPDLAMSLNNLSASFADVLRREDALDRAEEAVRTLAPAFAERPQALASQMAAMLRNYIALATNLQRSVNPQLVHPILQTLTSVETQDEREKD